MEVSITNVSQPSSSGPSVSDGSEADPSSQRHDAVAAQRDWHETEAAWPDAPLAAALPLPSAVQKLPDSPTAGDWLRLGDAANARRDWQTAAEAYRNVLQQSPNRSEIWVQYGHSLKEQGFFAQSESAYRKAIQLTPEVSDGHLQLGHALKLLGRLDEAHLAYAEAARLDPTNLDARRELSIQLSDHAMRAPAQDLRLRSSHLIGEVEALQLQPSSLTSDDWTTTSGAGAPGIAVALDRVLLLPGFGALAEGWVLAGAVRLTGMALKLGSEVLELDWGSLTRRTRDDLNSAYPMFRESALSPGFAGFFGGSFDRADVFKPSLKLQFADGFRMITEINPALLRYFDATYDTDALQRGFPSLALEPLFPPLVVARSALIRMQISDAARPMLIAEAGRLPVLPPAAERLLIQALPPDESDLKLVLDGVSRHLGTLPRGSALALICDMRQDRDVILRGIAAAQAATAGVAISLTVVEAVDHALLAVPAVLQFHQATRFGYAGADIWLTPEGWLEIADLLTVQWNVGRDRFASLLVQGFSHGSRVRRVDDELFVGFSRAFTRWVETALVPFDEAAQRRGLPRHAAPTDAAPAAMRLRAANRSVYKARLDRTVFGSEAVDS